MRNLVLFILLSTFLMACSREGTQDPNTGNTVTMSCQNPLPTSDSYRGEISLTKESAYIDVNTSVADGTIRIIRLYNEANCISRLDTDYIGKTDTYVLRSDHDEKRFGLAVVPGTNRINFVVDECDDVIAAENYRCVNLRNTDSGFFIIQVR